LSYACFQLWNRCDTDLVAAIFVEHDEEDGNDDDSAKENGSVSQSLPQFGLPVSGTIMLQRRDKPAFHE